MVKQSLAEAFIKINIFFKRLGVSNIKLKYLSKN